MTASDHAVRARVEGKLKTERRTVWRVEVGAIGIRCVWREDRFVVETRAGGRTWERIAEGSDATVFLRRAVLADAMGRWIEAAAKAAAR